MTQLDIFAVAERRRLEAPPYRVGSETSRQAAVKIAKPAARLRQRVLDYIVKQGLYGATDEDIAIGTDLNPSTARPRRLELLQAGAIVIAGERPGKSGRAMTIYRAREAA